MAQSLVLASGSKVRARLLQDAGLTFSIEPSDVDEDVIKQALKSKSASPEEIAGALAEAKSKASTQSKDRLVIGADQILVQGSEMFDKAKTISEAREKLKHLRGKTHHLVSAACVTKDGQVIWSTTNSVFLTMRAFSDEYLEAYLSRNQEAALTSVGAYQLEGEGVQLFDTIEGDYFTILGLPLLEILEVLRKNALISN